MIQSVGKSLVIPPGEGESYWTVGDLITFKIGPKQTNGAWSVAETTVVPGGGPPPHVHQREDETFYVLDGELQFVFGDDIFLAKPGDAFFLPRAIPHTFHNAAKTPARMLVMAAPCGFEKFMLEFARPKSESVDPPPVRKEDIDKLLAVAPKFGIEMLFDHKPKSAPKAANTTQKTVWVFGAHVDLKLMNKDTGGTFSLAIGTLKTGVGIPPHLHREMDELFYVQSGSMEFTLDGTPVTAPAGTTVFVPRGAAHGFKNVSQVSARFASYHFPGGFEDFFLDLGTDRADAPPADMSRVLEVCKKVGMELVH